MIMAMHYWAALRRLQLVIHPNGWGDAIYWNINAIIAG